MEESFRYIEILCKVGCGGHTANADFEYCIKATKTHLDLLETLDYIKMYGESREDNAIDILKGYHSKDVECVSIKWLRRNALEMWESLNRFYKGIFQELSETQYKEGNWTFEQYRYLRSMCDTIVDTWYDCFNQLMSAYNIKPHTKLISKHRTNGRQKGDKSRKRQDSEFDKNKLYDNTGYNGGLMLGYNISCIIKIKEVQACVFESVLKNKSDENKYDNTLYFKRALEQGKPEAISSGVRLEVLQFIFLKFAENYVEDKKEYLKRVEEGFYKLNPKFDFSDHNKIFTEIRNKIWDEEKEAFRQQE